MGGYLPQVFERFGSDYPAVMEAFRGLAERLHEAGPLSARERRLAKLGKPVAIVSVDWAPSATASARARTLESGEMSVLRAMGPRYGSFPAISKNERPYSAIVCANRPSSKRAAESRWLAVTVITESNAAFVAPRSSAAEHSARRARAVRTGVGIAAAPSQCFAPRVRAFFCSGESGPSTEVDSFTIRPTKKHASAISRGPPNGARPAIVASAGKGKAVGSSEYGARGAPEIRDTRGRRLVVGDW